MQHTVRYDHHGGRPSILTIAEKQFQESSNKSIEQHTPIYVQQVFFTSVAGTGTVTVPRSILDYLAPLAFTLIFQYRNSPTLNVLVTEVTELTPTPCEPGQKPLNDI